MTHGVPAPGAPAHLDPGATGGALESRPQPGWGGARNPGCQPPRKPRRRWGRGRSPQPLPSLAAGGGGKHRGRAATSAALGLAGPGHVSAPPTATRARFPNTAEGRVRGHRGCTAQTCVPRPQTSPRLLPRQVPGLPRGRGRPRPPHSPLGTGSAWLPQPRDAQSACVRVCLAWGRGGTGRAESRGAQAQSAPSLGADPRRALGVAGARGPLPGRLLPAPDSPPRRRE